MKYSPSGTDIVHHIGLDPFVAHYWARHQLNIFIKYATREISCLILDASGDIMRKFKKIDNVKTHVLYLYLGVICLAEGQIPVLQMLSESHDTNQIQYWLMEWIKSGASIPKEVVTDGSRALQTAVISAFTGYFTIEQYADACQGPIMPPCYVRLDNAHFIKIYSSFFKAANTLRRIKIFYLVALGQLIMAKTITEAKNILEALFFTLRSETDGKLPNGLDSEVEKAKDFLKKLIVGIDVSILFCF